MQRKNYTLRKTAYRSGIAMIMAISVIVILATIMALSISLSTKTTKQTIDLYVYEQSILLSKSAAEYALLQIARNQPCSYNGETFIQDNFYNINIQVRYIYTPDTIGICAANGGTLYTIVNTPEQNGSALLDISVDVNDTTVVPEPIRYFRRTIQKL